MKTSTQIKLSTTGRVIDPNEGYIGLDADGNVSEGYDSRLHHISLGQEASQDLAFTYGPDVFTAEERSELADIMILRWLTFKTRAAQKEISDLNKQISGFYAP
jgi:hypothetical protein